MDKSELKFISICGMLAGGDGLAEDLTECDFLKLYSLAHNNKLSASFYEYIKGAENVPANVKKMFADASYTVLIKQKSNYVLVKKIIEEFDNSCLDYAFFKGETIARLYRQPFLRYSSDSDIYVDSCDYKKARDVLEKIGYICIDNTEIEENVSTFYEPNYDHKIELHTSLYENYEGVQIQRLNKLDLTDTKKRIYISYDGLNIKTLGVQEHLIFQVFHFVKHFILTGVGIRYLIDFTLYINHYYEEIDWDSFWATMKYLEYDIFINNIFLICCKWFGLNLNVPQKWGTTLYSAEEETLLRDLLYVGDEKMQRKDGWQLIGNMQGYLEGEKKDSATVSGLQRVKNMIIPGRSEISSYYGYAKKYPWLLPFAWVHRAVHGIASHWKNENLYSLRQKLDVIDERKRLLKMTGLL